MATFVHEYINVYDYTKVNYFNINEKKMRKR